MVFIDTTSIYFEGEGGESLGKRGYSKDRPDLKQMIVAVVMDDEGYPVCCELLPGNTADVTTLVPVVDRLRKRFDIRDVCVVADRGMISEKTISELTQRGIHYILGARLRSVKEIRETVLSRGGRYREVHGPRSNSKSPSPLKVKQVFVESRRYIVCHNDEQARKDQADREAILEQLHEPCTSSPKQFRDGRKMPSTFPGRSIRRFPANSVSPFPGCRNLHRYPARSPARTQKQPKRNEAVIAFLKRALP